MMQNRFVTRILIGFDILLIFAFVFFCTRQQPDSAAKAEIKNVVDSYVEAMVYEDYQMAYGYLADLENKPTYEQFRQDFVNRYNVPADESVDVQIRTIDINGDEASVQLMMTDWPEAPFSDAYRARDQASLVKQDGQWKLSAMLTEYYWGEDWYQKPFWP